MATMHASRLYSDASRTLIAVGTVELHLDKSSNSCRLYGNIAPVAVIVCSPNETYAMDMQAKPAALDKLRQATPELESMMAAYENKQSGQG